MPDTHDGSDEKRRDLIKQAWSKYAAKADFGRYPVFCVPVPFQGIAITDRPPSGRPDIAPLKDHVFEFRRVFGDYLDPMGNVLYRTVRVVCEGVVVEEAPIPVGKRHRRD